MGSALDLIQDCLAIQEAGASAIVLEMVVEPIAKLLTKMLSIPTIGIGSGVHVNGQVLVYHDLLGLLRGGHNPRFAKQFTNLAEIAESAMDDFRREVQCREFPRKIHSFPAPAGVFDKVKAELTLRGMEVASTTDDCAPIRNVCIIGGGAMASLFAARIGNVAKVTMLSNHVEHLDAIRNQGGLHIKNSKQERFTPGVEAFQSVEKVQSSLLGQEIDLMMILVKSRDTMRAEQALKLMGQNTILLSLQNGLGHAEVLFKAFGRDRVVLGTTSMGATLGTDPGSVLHLGTGPTTLSAAGWSLSSPPMSDAKMAAGRQVAQRIETLLEQCFFDARVALDAADMQKTVLAKLLVNAVVNPLTAMYNLSNGDLMLPKHQTLTEALAAETSCVLRLACGFKMANPMGNVLILDSIQTQCSSSIQFKHR